MRITVKINIGKFKRPTSKFVLENMLESASIYWKIHENQHLNTGKCNEIQHLNIYDLVVQRKTHKIKERKME